MTKCKQPVMWKAICKSCGTEVCRFCSEPHDNWRTDVLPPEQWAFDSTGLFSQYFLQLIAHRNNGNGIVCQGLNCESKEYELVSEKWTNIDLFRFYQELIDTAKSVTDSAHKLGQLRKYVESGKIAIGSFSIMYTNILGIMDAMNALTKERMNQQYFLDDVMRDLEF